MESAQTRIRGLAGSLASAGAFLEVMAVVWAVGGIISGIVVAFHSGTNAIGVRTHPRVGLGIVFIFGTVLTAMFYWAIARALRLFGEYTAFRTGPGLNDAVSSVATRIEKDGWYWSAATDTWRCVIHDRGRSCRECGESPSGRPSVTST